MSLELNDKVFESQPWLQQTTQNKCFLRAAQCCNLTSDRYWCIQSTVMLALTLLTAVEEWSVLWSKCLAYPYGWVSFKGSKFYVNHSTTHSSAMRMG